MNIQTESYGHAVILILEDELTEDSLSVLQRVVDRQLGGPVDSPRMPESGMEVIDLVLNMEKVPFIDSAGLEYLLDLQDRLVPRMGRVKLLKPDINVRKVLEMCRLDSTFEVYTDLPEAVRLINS